MMRHYQYYFQKLIHLITPTLIIFISESEQTIVFVLNRAQEEVVSLSLEAVLYQKHVFLNT